MSKKKHTEEELAFLMDLRVRDRNLDEGLISAKELDSHLEALPDDEEQGEWVELPVIEPLDSSRLGKKGGDDGDEQLLT